MLNILICMRKRLQRESIGFYSPLISTFNITSLLYGFFVLYLPTSSYYLASSLNCKLFFYLGRITLQMTSWLYAMCSLDRMIWITYPDKYKIFKNRNFLASIALGLFALICVLNVQTCFTLLEKMMSVNARYRRSLF